MPSFELEGKRFAGVGALWSDASDADSSPPDTADEFARHVIRTICQASVTPAVGRRVYERCMRALEFGSTARIALRHPGKADAVDSVWRKRERLFSEYAASSDRLSFIAALPWIGPVTKLSLARRLGLYAEQGRRAVA